MPVSDRAANPSALRGKIPSSDCGSLTLQDGHAERLIGSSRRECLDHVIVFGEAHLRRVLNAYASYYNQVRIHLSLDKDAPEFRHPQRMGNILALPLLGGLLHHYVRV